MGCFYGKDRFACSHGVIKVPPSHVPISWECRQCLRNSAEQSLALFRCDICALDLCSRCVTQLGKRIVVDLPDEEQIQLKADPAFHPNRPPAMSSCSSNYLSDLRSRFSDCDADKSGYVTPTRLAQWWVEVATSKLGRQLDAVERSLIAASVERNFEQWDTSRDGQIDVDEWVHSALLDLHSQGPAVAAAITNRIRELSDFGFSTSKLVSDWVKMDEDGRGLILRDQVGGIAFADLDEDTTQKELMDRMDSCGKMDISYVEFCAHALGMEYQPVQLNLYDLSKHISAALSPILFGHQEKGIWHAGVGAFGNEYYYYEHIRTQARGETDNPFGFPTKTVELGLTLRTEDELDALLKEIDHLFQPELYDVFEHNCIHMCEKLVRFLLGRSIPDSVRLQCERIKAAAPVKVMRPLLNEFLGGRRTSYINSGTQLSAEGQFVLVEFPDCSVPVIAYVQKAHNDGTSDLYWMDCAGNRRQTAGFRSVDLTIWQTSDIYTTVLKALEDDDTQQSRCDDVACSRTISSGSFLKCPEGHILAAKELRIWQGRFFRQHCLSCGSGMPHDEIRMWCHICRYQVCRNCWLLRVSTSTVRTRAGFRMSFQSQYCCPSGHSLERLSGQTIRGDRSCHECGRQELGATAPYFFSCRPCCYDLCPDCARMKLHV